MVSRILVPLDGSKLAEAILPHVEYLSGVTGATVLLVGVAVPIHLYTDIAIEYPVSEDEQEIEIKQYLKGIDDEMTRKGIKVQTFVRFGHAADEILDLAKEQQADLIAVCTHGRSGVGRWVFGSVADKVLRAASIPVLIYRPSAPRRA